MNESKIDMKECETSELFDVEMKLPPRVAHFQVREMIGDGGCGLLYKAYDQNLDRLVALKFLKPSLKKDFVTSQRFKLEAKTAASIDHGNIVSIHYFGELEDLPFIAMEYVPGQSLAELNEPLAPARAIDYMRQTAEGLKAAVEAGHIHRDIKPANLLLRDDGVIKIADFGLARPIDRSNGLTAGNTIVGTPNFISPEQACAEAVDCRTDMYSLGATFYYLLSGRLPFQGETITELLYCHAYNDPTPLAQHRKLPPKLCKIITKLMEKNPDDRFSSYEELIELLAQIKLNRSKTKSKKQRQSFENRTKSAKHVVRFACVKDESKAWIEELTSILLGTGGLLALASLIIFLFAPEVQHLIGG